MPLFDFPLVTTVVVCTPIPINNNIYNQVEVPKWEEIITGDPSTKIRLLRIQITN